MNLTEARIMVEELLQELAPAVAFKWDNGKKRFGCYNSAGIISLSRPLTQANKRDVVRDVILHEIAHHRAGVNAGHGRLWKAHAVALGTSPARCVDVPPVQSGGWIGTCPNCGLKERAFRMGKNMKAGRIHCRKCYRRVPLDRSRFAWRKAPARRKTS